MRAWIVASASLAVLACAAPMTRTVGGQHFEFRGATASDVVELETQIEGLAPENRCGAWASTEKRLNEDEWLKDSKLREYATAKAAECRGAGSS